MPGSADRSIDQPFTDDELALMSMFAGVSADVIRVVAWLAVMKEREVQATRATVRALS